MQTIKICLPLLLLFVFACNKDDSSPNNSTKTKTELLINKKWQVIAISGKLANGTPVPDGYSSLPDYDKDDYYFYKSDLTFEVNDNVKKHPNSSEQVIDYGTWAFVNSDQYLQMTSTKPQQGTLTYFPQKILELTEQSLKTEAVDAGNTIWVTYKPL